MMNLLHMNRSPRAINEHRLQDRLVAIGPTPEFETHVGKTHGLRNRIHAISLTFGVSLSNLSRPPRIPRSVSLPPSETATHQ